MLKTLVVIMMVFISNSGTAYANDFPVTVEHVFGETVVENAPLRVVSLGQNDHDFLYALGVAPVAVTEWWGRREYATWPWAEETRAQLKATPNVLKSVEANIEWVIKQNPDLIVAVYSDIDETQYKLLSKIAPVILRPKKYPAFGAPWQDQLKQIDLALTGKNIKSSKIIAKLNQKISTLRARYPQFNGATGAMADYRGGQVTMWSNIHGPTRFMESLGIKLPQNLNEKSDAKGWIYISPEEIDLIDLDVVVWPNGNRKKVSRLATYRKLKLSIEERSVWLPGNKDVLSAALWFQTPLSIDYALDKAAPLLAAAIDGDPITQIQYKQ